MIKQLLIAALTLVGTHSLFAVKPFSKYQLKKRIVEIPVKETIRGFFKGNKFPLKATNIRGILGKKQYNSDEIDEIRPYWVRAENQQFKRGQVVLVPHQSRHLNNIEFVFGIVLSKESNNHYAIQIGEKAVIAINAAEIYKFDLKLYNLQ